MNLHGWLEVRRARAEWKRRKRAVAAANKPLRPAVPGPRGEMLLTGIVLIAVAALVLGLVLGGCSSEPLPELAPAQDASAPDAGSAASPDAGAEHVPQCREVGDGEQFPAAATADAAPVLILNHLCTRVCHNTAGGQTCIALSGDLVDCARCAS